MNKIFAKFMALTLSAAMIIPSVAFANEQVTEEIEVDTFALKEAFYADVTVDEDGFVFSNSANDESRNIIMQSKGEDVFAEEHANHSGTPEYNKNIKYCVAVDSDGASTFKEVDGQNTIFTAFYHATKAAKAGRYNRAGCINVYAGKAFPYNVASNLVIEYDYYGESAARMRFRYANAASGSSSYIQFNKVYDESVGAAWQTASFELEDFYPDADDTGLGAKIDGKGGSTSDASFRIEALDDTAAVKAIRVFTPGYMDLKAAIDAIEIENADEIRENFEVPVSVGDVEIQWTSENNAITIDESGNATVTRDPYGNISGNLVAKAVYGDYYLESVIPTTVFTSNETQAELDNHIANLKLDVSDMANVISDFTLPVAPDGYEYEWASTNEDYVDVSDQVNAYVNASKFQESAATILVTVYHGDKYGEAEFDVSSPALYKEVKGSETIVDMNGDIQVVGNITFDGAFTSDDIVYEEKQIPVDADGNPYGSNQTYYLTHSSPDYSNARGMMGGKAVVVGGNAYSTKRGGGIYYNMNLPINVGTGFTEDDKELTIEIEYFDKYAGTKQVRYQRKDASGNVSVSANNSNLVMEGTGTWKTWKHTVTDAYFVEDSKTSCGMSGKADIRLEWDAPIYVSRVAVYNGDGFKEIAAAKDTVEIKDVDLANVEDNFELPLTGDDGVEIEWASKDSSIIDIDDGIAYIYPSTDGKVTTTLTAAIMKNGVYTTKDFEVTLKKLPKQTPNVTEPTVTKGDTTTNVEFTVENTGNMRGQQLTAFAYIVDDATGKVIANKTNSVVVTSSTTTVDVDIQNATDGQTLGFYVVNEFGAIIKNRAPSTPAKIVGKSTQQGGKVTWEAAGDDYHHVVYDVYKDGVLWIEGTEETEAVYETDSTVFSQFYVIARDHEGLKTAATEVVKSGKYIAQYVDFNDSEFRRAPVVAMEAEAKLDRGIHTVKRTGADTVDGDGTTPVTYTAMATYSGAERQALGAASNKTSPTRMQFKAEGIIPTDKITDHVFIIVKYFDEGTGAVDITYSQDTVLASKKGVFQITGTNTWKEAVIEITDANFTRGGNGVEGADFFLTTNANQGILAINKVTVIPAEFY